MSGPYIHPKAIVDSTEIGSGTRVWAFAHVMAGASIGKLCNVGEGCFVEEGAHLGDHVTLKNGVAVWTGVRIEDYAFIGPNVVFTNDLRPRAWIKSAEFTETIVRTGASIGANATVVCGVILAPFSFVAAGSVVTRNTRPHELVMGNPAKYHAWVCACARTLSAKAETCECGSAISWTTDGEPRVAGDHAPLRQSPY